MAERERVICRPYTGNFAGAQYEPDPESHRELVEVLREVRPMFDHVFGETGKRIDAMIALLEGNDG